MAAGVGGLFYTLLQSRVLPTDADGAGNALQAWDMLHGNVLLSGWSLSDVSFYTTELPEYMLVELVRGLNADVHVAAAITLAGVLAMVLAIGRATGREAAVRALVVAAIMLAPALGTASGVLLLSPDHVGTQVPLLLILLVLDRAKPRWYARRHRRAGCVDGAGRPACRARRRHSAGGGGRRSAVPAPGAPL